MVQNGLDGQVYMARKAVAGERGRLTMRLTPGNSGGSFVVGTATGARDAGAQFEEVEADTLEAILAECGLAQEEVAFVWADVQGCETEVIASGSALWKRGVPLWAEVEPTSLGRQGGLDTFVNVAAAHFDRFIEADELKREGAAAVPQPISRLGRLVDSITPEQVSTDVLLLPPGVASPSGAAR